MSDYVNNIIDYFRSLIEDKTPEEKFMILNILDKSINIVKDEVSNEWTYCAGCNQYVKVQERKTVNNGDGTYTIVCGNCGIPHHHRGIINLFERDKCCK